MGYHGIRASQAPSEFAEEHFGDVDLGDRRLTKRAVKIATSIATSPHSSLPRQCGDSHQAKAAYRFFKNDLVTGESISAQHREHTIDSARAEKTVLLVQDTTELSFGPTSARTGLGQIGYGEGGDGLLMHSTLAITPGASGVVLGLADVQVWARKKSRQGETQAKRRQRTDRESLRWKASIECIGAPPKDHRWVHVGDREADVWETFLATRDVGCDCVIRAGGAAGKRKTVLGHPDAEPDRNDADDLVGLARSLPSKGRCDIVRNARRGTPRRTIKLNTSFSAATILQPKLCKDKSCCSLPVWIVRAWEDASDAGKDKPTEWVLVTTVPVFDVKAALQIVEWYRHRWTIEEYHKCLKTGCRVEERQLQDGARLEPLAVILAIVALRLLNLKKIAKLRPQAPARDAVPAAYVKALAKLRGIPESELTCDRFWRETAKLGGFLGRNSDGDPGWKTLWLGWHDLEMLVAGMKLANVRPSYG